MYALISALSLILAMKLRGTSEFFSPWLGTHEAQRLPPASSLRELCALERSLLSFTSIPKITIRIKSPSFSKSIELIAILSHKISCGLFVCSYTVMGGRKSPIGRAHWVSMFLCVYMALQFGGFTSAALLDRRQAGMYQLTGVSLLQSHTRD